MNQDLKIRLIGIPLLSLLICLFFNSFFFLLLGYSFWIVLLSNFIFTLMATEGTRALVFLARKHHSDLRSTRTRLLFTLLFLILQAPLIGTAHLYIEKDLLYQDQTPKTVYDFLSVAGSTLFFTAIVASAYEAAFYLRRWKSATAQKDRVEKMNLQTQLFLLKTQVQPHFLFNCLNTLSSLVDEDGKKAKRFIKEMASIYRQLLRNNEHQLVSVEQEIQFAHSYLFLLKTRFESGLHVDIEIHPSAAGRFLPPLSLQLLLENAVKHNQISTDLPLAISIIAQDNQITVTNNIRKRTQYIPSEKIGLSNLISKFRLLNLPPPIITETSTQFIVVLNLAKEQSFAAGLPTEKKAIYENSDN